MIRSRSHLVICVRKPNQEVVTNVEEVKPLSQRHRALGWPFIRGIAALPETLYLGFKGLFFSANAAIEEEEGGEQEKFTWKEFALAITLALGVAALFFIVPFFLATWLNLTGVIFNVAEAIIRLGLFIAYLAAISSWGEFHRVLQYHGAEHKAINALEAGAPMDIENVKRYSRLHPRCGTSFLFLIVIVSIILFSIVPDFGLFWLRLAYRIILIPIIASISYELLRLSGKYKNSPIMRVFTFPGITFQRLATKEPTDDMLEVSIKAVNEATRLSASKQQLSQD
ncbi:MAG TPA: DUF1385 domain-containing protein [Candidatus Sulfotelmatobacter sp.]|jgi:uncharacterized protein YqhQ|nr:DUF1385 domain-containing protein [Candidatus Sulfotelmatobacter sp.]